MGAALLEGRRAALSADQAADYEPWIANHRRIRELLGRLEAIGIAG